MNMPLLNKFNLNSRMGQAAVSLVIFLLALFFSSYRLNYAPDIFSDEIIYTRVGVRLVGEGALIWDSGTPFLVHPPLYFLTEGIYQALTGNSNTPLYSPGDIFQTVVHTRWLNTLFGAITCLGLYWFGRKLRGNLLGFLLAGLFILDPFALRINRRAMLESLAMLLSLAALFSFWLSVREKPDRKPQGIVIPGIILAGLFAGAALLTKELTFIFLFPPILLGLWELVRLSLPRLPSRREVFTNARVLIQSLIVTAVALITYSLYPLWVWISGNTSVFYQEKSLGLLRLLGIVQITGWNRPGISFSQILLERLTNYGTSYLILAAAGVSLLGLVLWGRERLSSRFLVSNGVVLYPFFAFVALFGSGNDQFFYFLLVPAIIILGFSTFVVLHKIYSIKDDTPNRKTIVRISYWTIFASLSIILVFNTVRWISSYGVGLDNGYSQLSNYIKSNLPEGELINASGDPIKLRYFLPEQQIAFAATPDEAMGSGVHYFVLAPKDVIMHYGRIQPELEEWILARGNLLYSTSGNSYGDIYLYKVDYSDTLSKGVLIPSKHQMQGSRFQEAQGGRIGLLILLIVLWILVCVGIMVGINYHNNRKRMRGLFENENRL